jgi:GntR family transcriptional regulator, transcriptional repressor for pyruvate dehydrogenase complex
MAQSARKMVISQDDLARNLMERFILGEEAQNGMLPSTRLLAEEYGVSRLFLREVLAGLQRQGVIETFPGKGVFVKKPDMLNAAKNVHTTIRQSSATARDLIEARSHLEEQCASLAAVRATDEDIEQMEVALKAFDDATTLIPRAQADIAFHSLIAKSTHNPVLLIMFGSITKLAFDTMLRSLSDPKIFNVGAPLHREILKAIKKRDSKAALNAMSKHIHLAEKSYKSDLDRQLSDIAERIVKDVLQSTLSVDQILDAALQSYSVEIKNKS